MAVFSKILQALILLPCVGCLVWLCLATVNEGTIIGFLLFGAIIVCTLFYKRIFSLLKRAWKHIAGKICIILGGAVIATGAFAAAFFSVQMANHMHKPLDNVNAVLVLGCRVKGETPSSMLWHRTRTAYDVLCEFPDAVAVVSGGQGNGEDITEAEAMRRLLTEWGIDESRILIEDKSTSTAENFDFSVEILKQHGITDGIAVVTSEYHQYRASLYAKRSGLTDTGCYSAATMRNYLLNSWIREWAALAATFVFGY